MNSILTSVKKLLGVAEEYEHFDMDIVMHINSVLAILNQLGVGPPEGFSIEGKEAVWDDFLPGDSRLRFVKAYIFLRVKQLFDPPVSSALMESVNRQISELEWRLTVGAEENTNGKENGCDGE